VVRRGDEARGKPGDPGSPEPGPEKDHKDLDEALDEASEESFPASDPPAVSRVD
jgi:hypothetical protein